MESWAQVVDDYFSKFGEDFPTMSLTDKQMEYVYGEAVKAIKGDRGVILSSELYDKGADY